MSHRWCAGNGRILFGSATGIWHECIPSDSGRRQGSRPRSTRSVGNRRIVLAKRRQRSNRHRRIAAAPWERLFQIRKGSSVGGCLAAPARQISRACRSALQSVPWQLQRRADRAFAALPQSGASPTDAGVIITFPDHATHRTAPGATRRCPRDHATPGPERRGFPGAIVAPADVAVSWCGGCMRKAQRHCSRASRWRPSRASRIQRYFGSTPAAANMAIAS